MFGKKPSPPPAKTAPQPAAPASQPSGWAMQALTTDYVVSGFMPPSETPLLGHLNVPTLSMLILSNAQWQPLSGQAPAAGASVSEAVLPKSTLLAVIPQDEAGRRSAAQQMPNRSARIMVYIGPFVLRAALMMPGDMPVRNAFSVGSANLMALTEVDVACLLPGARLAPFKAPVVILNKTLVQFYHSIE